MKFINITLFIISIFVFSCQEGEKTPHVAKDKMPMEKSGKNHVTKTQHPERDTVSATFPYRVKKADAVVKLPQSLTEISGLSPSDQPGIFWSVNDEKGKIYAIDIAEGKIKEELKFAKNGDFEGVEQVGDKVYAVKSNGILYAVENVGKKNQHTEIYKTELSSKHNVEGLGFDLSQNALLIACKANPDKKEGDFKSIFLFDLDQKKLLKDSVIRLKKTAVDAYLSSRKSSKKLNRKLFSLSGYLKFAPSGIAVHPVNGHLFLISSVGKLIIVMERNGEVLHIAPIGEKAILQPEGISFDRDGTMYISSEGRGGKGRLARFDMQ